MTKENQNNLGNAVPKEIFYRYESDLGFLPSDLIDCYPDELEDYIYTIINDRKH